MNIWQSQTNVNSVYVEKEYEVMIPRSECR